MCGLHIVIGSAEDSKRVDASCDEFARRNYQASDITPVDSLVCGFARDKVLV